MYKYNILTKKKYLNAVFPRFFHPVYSLFPFYKYPSAAIFVFSMSFPITFPAAVHPNKAEQGQDWVIVSVSADDSYYLLEYNSPPDNRYTAKFIAAYLQALDYIRTQGEPRVLVTTSRLPKFFSNGLDFEAAISTPGFFDEYYYRLMRTILEFPWPTVALVNGHGFAAGFMVAACHDYRVMNPDKGFLCMNEVAFGADLLPPMMSIFRVKFGSQLSRKIAQEGHRFTSKEALDVGIIDVRGGLAEVEALIKAVAGKYVKSPSYSHIRQELLKEVIADTRSFDKDAEILTKRYDDQDAFYSKRGQELEQLVKSKL